MTESPTLQLVTPSPTASTTPAASWPRMDGKMPSGSCPESVYASVWHSAACVIFTRTSPFCGGDTMTDASSRGAFGATAIAAVQVISSFFVVVKVVIAVVVVVVLSIRERERERLCPKVE